MVFLFLLLQATAAPPTPDPGPQPTWPQAIEMGNRSLVSQLIDPESARVAWPYRFYAGAIRIAFEKATEHGWITCGLVNAKNRMGGYTGSKPFVIVERDGRVVALNMGAQAKITCESLAKQGLLQASGAPIEPQPVAGSPSADSQQQSASAPVAGHFRTGSVGVAFIPTNAGLVVMEVAPNSPASAAGLKLGEVLESVNGIDLRAMPEAAVLAVLKGTLKAMAFQVVGRGKVVVQRP